MVKFTATRRLKITAIQTSFGLIETCPKSKNGLKVHLKPIREKCQPETEIGSFGSMLEFLMPLPSSVSLTQFIPL